MQILPPPDTLKEKSQAISPSIETQTGALKPSRAGKAFTTAALGILSLTVFLALLELFLDLNHIGEQEYLKVDPVIGFAHLENKLVTDRTEALGIAAINSDGLCDVEHFSQKADGTQRIALLGDSITEALQVPLDKRFARVLEQKLNAGLKTKFEIINFGVGGFGTGQEYLQYVRDVRRYKPDQVILMYHQGDETENSPDGSKWSLQPTFTLDAENYPQARYQEFDTWRKSASAAPLTFFDWGRRHSHIWQCLLQTHNSLKNEPIYKRITDLAEKIDKGLTKLWLALNRAQKQTILARTDTEEQAVQYEREQLLQSANLKSDVVPVTPQYDSSKQWLLTKQLIALLSKECHRDHTRLSIVFVPALEKPVDMRPDFDKKIKELTETGKVEGFETCDLSQKFYSAQADITRPIILKAHLSPHGHDMVAEEIQNYLLK